MDRRRLLPLVLAAAFLLAVPASALAAPEFRPAEIRDTDQPAAVAPDVAADRDGNAGAVWVANGELRAAYRPHGGPWGPAESLDPVGGALATQPRVVATPDGELVAVWLISDGSSGAFLRWARRPAGGAWSDAETISQLGCCPQTVEDLLAGADGGVTAIASAESALSSYRREAGAEGFGSAEPVPSEFGSVFATAPDGSVLAAAQTDCNPDPEATTNCIGATRRPAAGPWGAQEVAALLPPLVAVTGLAAAGNLDSSYSIVWGEVPAPDGFVPPGSVHSVDRAAGDAGTWDELPRTVVDLAGDDVAYCNGLANCFDLAVGADGTQLALWQQSGAAGNRIEAALRDGPGSAWGAVQEAGPAGSTAAPPFGAITASGFPVAAWGSPFSAGAAHGSHREGGAWQPVELSDTAPRGLPADAVFLGDLAADGEGNAVTAWRDITGVGSAGFDATGPRFTAFGLPSGSAGQALAFSAAAVDNWAGPASISWDFGDNTGAAGASVAHAYGAAGTFTATARATDAVDNRTEQSGPVGVAPAPSPTPDPCGTADADKDGIEDGCDTNNGARRPRPFKTVNATVVSGDVFVKLPAGSAGAAQAKPPKGFVRLEGAETIPVGSILDTARGRVKIRSAATTGRKLQTGQFFRGRFKIRQVRIKRRSKRLITDMRLTGSSFRKACRARASVSAKRKRSKKRVRRLFGDATGSFRTSGRNAAATVRGTRWGVQDRCDGTLVAVQRGRVQVRDKVKRKTIILRAGKTYLARVR